MQHVLAMLMALMFFNVKCFCKIFIQLMEHGRAKKGMKRI
jgi:hypothetical protein